MNFKPLIWMNFGDLIEAKAFGIDAFYRIRGQQGDWTLISPAEDRYVETPGYETQSAAKAAAQVDFQRRILLSLAPLDRHPQSGAVLSTADILG